MKSAYLSSETLERLVEERRRSGAGRLDECWEGVWHWTDPTGRHQRIAFALCRILADVVDDGGPGTAWISINVTDREEGWTRNHRCPDGAVILRGNAGFWLDGDAAFLGGPDLVLEVLSPGDDTYEKLPFYAERGVREVLIVEPVSFHTEIRRLRDGELESSTSQASEVTGLVFDPRDGALEVRHPESGRRWTIR